MTTDTAIPHLEEQATASLHILLVEDNPGDARLIEHYLDESSNDAFVIMRAEKMKEAVELLKDGHFDVVLLDLNLPDSTGVDTFLEIKTRAPTETAVVIMTGLQDSKLATQALRAGAQDYLCKGQILGPDLVRALHHASERKRAQHLLHESRELLRSVIDVNPCSIFVKDRQGRYLLVNRAMAEIYDKAPEEMRGLTDNDLVREKKITKEAATRFKEEDDLVFLEQHMSVKPAQRAVLADGTARWFQTVKLPLEYGQTDCVLGVSTDITARRKAEQVAQQRLKFLETLLDTLPNPIFYKDAEGYYTGCNNAFTAMTGFSTADIQGKTVFDIAPPEIAERYHEKDLELLRDGGTQRYEWQVTDSTGNLRDVIFDKAAIVDENNNISGIIGILSDITERKKAEELRIAKEAADEAAESKARFFAKASHELRSPLNSIIGFTEALADGIYGALNEKQSKALSNVMESGHLLKQLINDLLDLSKIEAGKTELDISEIELRSWIEEAVQVVQGNLLRKHQDVEMRFQEAGKDTRLPGDRRRLTQVMINLLTNASKFSPRDETIIVRAGFDDKLLRVDVCDAGIGIAKKTIETIFEPFCQGTSASDTQPGTGLGLSLAKEIVELHGGRMWAESPSPLHTGKRENPGSMFSFTIPLNQHNGEA